VPLLLALYAAGALYVTVELEAAGAAAPDEYDDEAYRLVAELEELGYAEVEDDEYGLDVDDEE